MLLCITPTCCFASQPRAHAHAPLHPTRTRQIILNVAINRRRPTIPDWCPPGLRALITACWRDDPRQRPPARALVARLCELQRREGERRALVLASAAARRTTSLTHGAPVGERRGGQARRPPQGQGAGMGGAQVQAAAAPHVRLPHG